MVKMVAVGEIKGIAQALKEVERDVQGKLGDLAEYTGLRTIAYLKSLTKEMRPPARKANGEWTGWRHAHPGHWGDVSSVLVNSYGHHVSQGSGWVRLELRNTADYAEKLDRRDGFFVLRGVADPGGPVERVLEAGVAIVAPDWKVTRP